VVVLVAQLLLVSDSLDLQELFQSPLSVEAALELLSVRVSRCQWMCIPNLPSRSA
jgi:hypothetical protein